MEDATQLVRTIDELAAHDPRYHREAYLCVMAALQATVSRLEQPRHITGRELLDGWRTYVLEQYGPMARTVLQAWGVRATADIGDIVFALVDARVLGKIPTDLKEDFNAYFTFDEALDRSVRYTLPVE